MLENFINIGIVGAESWKNNPWTKKYLIKLVGEALDKVGARENANSTSELLGRLVYIAADQGSDSAAHLLPLVAKRHRLYDCFFIKTYLQGLTKTESNPHYIFNDLLSDGSFDAVIVLPPHNKYHNDLLAKLTTTTGQVKKPIIING